MSEDDLRKMLLEKLTAQYGELMKTREAARAMRMHENSVRAISPEVLPRGGGYGRRGLVFMTVDVVTYMIRHCRHAARQEVSMEGTALAA